jgi:hypothetical protein
MLAASRTALCGLANAGKWTMNTIVFQAKKSGRNYVEPAIGPMNRSEEAQFGLVDFLLTVSFLLCAGGLVWLVMARWHPSDDWSGICYKRPMSTVVLDLDKITSASSAVGSSAINPVQPRSPLGITVLNRKPTLADNLIAIAFVLCVAGLMWLLWDQQQLLQ